MQKEYTPWTEEPGGAPVQRVAELDTTERLSTTHMAHSLREGGFRVSELHFYSEHIVFTDAACCEVTL